MTDFELLEQHREGSREAFAELVRRHIDWVYSAARRRVVDAHLAEDVTQAVFEVLARKLPRLKPGQTLSIWLFGVLSLTCKALLRKEARRHRHETEAAKMRSTIETTEPDHWQELAPQLDGIVEKLRHGDRQAVLLRFYEQKSFAEVGQVLGISEEAARKRVSRAVEKLRAKMNVKSGAISASAIAGILLAEAIKPAPVALAASISSSGPASSMTGAVITLMKWSQLKFIGATILASLLIAGGGALALMQLTAQPVSPAVQADKQAFARDLLARYQNSLDALTKIHYRYRGETRYEGNFNPAATRRVKREVSGEFFRDGSRISLLSIVQGTNAPDEQKVATNLDRYITGPDNMEPGAQLTFQSTTNEPQDRWEINVDHSPPPSPPSYFSSESMELWGLVQGENGLLAHLMADAPSVSVRDAMDQVNGHATYVIDAQMPSGKHSIWIDPQAGYLARRIEIHKADTDLDNSQPLNRPPPKLPEGATSIFPPMAIKALDYVIDQIQIEKIGQTYVPVSVSTTLTRTFVDGTAATIRSDRKREDIDLNPDFAALHAFTLDVPDGTRVVDMDNQKPDDPRFEWRQGKIVQMERLYGRAVREDGTPVRISWRAQIHPDGQPRASMNWLPEDIRADGLFSVSLTLLEKELFMKNGGGILEIRDRAGTLGEVNISELSTDRDHPPQFTFPKK